ncbi:VRR-NUC domain-containing protein [uncultured Paraglaciecola sp.]|uniref:VRR-NUC domain-containing protein n=1 Tax=uncultured Paraglaciecola sp. TaxID=1765024 RepID=UPI00262846D8|nr:VRR-NUC domain-containing protein [uncultured Paraglaciecola sp.]
MLTEAQEQKAVAQYLDYTGLLWCHVPNGGKRNKIIAANLKREGAKAGVPDILIFEPVHKFVGTAIELKIQKGGRLSEPQKEWLQALQDRNWCTRVCNGADYAIQVIKELYGV